MVYVDPIQPTPQRWHRKWKYPSYCHMFADSEQELQDFARQLGLRKGWFQDGSIPHFDLTANKRLLARRLGALEVSTKEWIRRLRVTDSLRIRNGGLVF